MYYRQMTLIENAVLQWIDVMNANKEITYFPLGKELYFAKQCLNQNVLSYFAAIAAVILCTFFSFILEPYVDRSNLIMIYLLGLITVATSQREVRGAAVIAALFSTLSFDFFFTTPRFNLAIAHWGDMITLVVMFVVAQTISHLNIRIRRHSEATRKAQMQAETERFRNILLMSISHDLRTPLTVIMGSASSLLQAGDKLTNTMKKELIQHVYHESKRLNQLVSNILQIIRLESQPIQISKELHVIEEVIGSALNKLEISLLNKQIKIALPDGVPLIPIDNILIEQVLINLIENSIKFTSDDSPIEISVELLSAKSIIIKIADHGPGIDPNEIEKIFDKFYQGQKPETNGIGLGLTLCKSVVQAHGGRIWALNREQGGAMFCFTLPIV